MPSVFVVDDDLAGLKSVTTLLATAGFEVRSFESAEAFLASTDKSASGLLLCDFKLPGMSGLELYRAVKADGIDIRVILITGYTDAELEKNVTELGVQAILDKPVAPAALLEHVRNALQADS